MINFVYKMINFVYTIVNLYIMNKLRGCNRAHNLLRNEPKPEVCQSTVGSSIIRIIRKEWTSNRPENGSIFTDNIRAYSRNHKHRP